MIEPPPTAVKGFTYIWTKWLSGLYEFLQSKGVFSSGGVIQIPTETTTNLADVSHSINTSNYKIEGSMVFNETTNKPVWAVGNAAADVWVDATGSTVHSPI